MGNGNTYDFLDALTAVSFLMSLANYKENITQSGLQEIVHELLSSIDGHLQEQDRKIDEIYNMLKEGEKHA